MDELTDLIGGIGIAAVERDTGISKETLRVWERRYGFPSPARDACGERLYPPEQVQRLRLVKRLLDAGHRPGRVVAASVQELSALLQPTAALSGNGATLEAAEIAACIALLQGHDVDGLRRVLSQVLMRRGLAHGIAEVLAPLTTRIGELWMGGALQVFEEHIYSESLQLVLRQAIQALPPAPGRSPKVLLTTLPGESHALGLLMAEALLSLEGALCLSLGAQTPLAQLPAAAQACQADVVALSFSGQLPQRAVLEGLVALREQLPPAIEIWAGGSSRALRLPGVPEGIRCLDGLAAIAPEMTRWRELLESRV
ncbi:DNA-binding transcriptional MerR regulator/methylmalonyl-CoA mutase cobalamin-binding subunit [Pelomonas saccharophila]|uniref:DNA-binding transcriptional MerR regulator/methylmalonyl-CoA mutase cobalamin-binding subunit n=1 Tax=Roseateles saccharophilus TaxID=304 RepID=A0ABU1YLZ2_ROSSA|nr:MerR family transcriptional regulator [Roseateles saccharophilus]MDR7269758.1 DNA-binding transcriptional MerR regulator/methylmalonyl-CoA mutase cobalamin-binding subunit [Roseateles saccharophilus]